MTDFHCLISWTVILSSRLTGSSLRVVSIWYLSSRPSQPPVQRWATYGSHCRLAHELVLRALLIPQNNFKNSSSPREPISVDDRNCQTGKQMEMAAVHWGGCTMYEKKKKNPQVANRSTALSSLSPRGPVWSWKNFISALKKKDLWASCFFISEAASPFMRVGYFLH